MGEALSMKALEDFRNELSALADAELVKEGFCREKTTALEAAEARLKKTRAAWRETDRNREKVLRHRDIWREEDAKEAAQQEDKEAEDFKPILFVDESGAEDR
jgi:hypothetical protein